MIRRLLQRQQGGVALAMVLGFIVLAVPLITSALSLASTLSIDSRVKTNVMRCHYSALGGEAHARSRLLYESGYADTIPSDGSPVSEVLTQNGCDSTITISKILSEASGDSMDLGGVDYVVEEDHEIEVKITVNDDSGLHMMFAYDTTDHPSRVRLPSASGSEFDMDLYLHNNPTPPIGDTNVQHPLPTDGNAPTATTLYNYDQDRDNYPGRFLQRSDDPVNENHKFKYQNWRTTPLASEFHIFGNPKVDLWLAMMNFDPDFAGTINICLRDKDGSNFTTIICETFTIDPDQWEPDGFAGFVDVDIFSIQSLATGHAVDSVLSIKGDGTHTVDSWTIN